MRVYPDTAVIVYLVEFPPGFGPAAEAKLLSLGAVSLVSTELARMESLVVPVRTGDTTLVQEFEDFFARHISQWVPLDRTVFDRAVAVRAAYRTIKTPDAIHLAAAIVSGCDVFLTNDHALAAFPDIRVEVI
jgi:predicted nucleic acid-binding protein